MIPIRHLFKWSRAWVFLAIIAIINMTVHSGMRAQANPGGDWPMWGYDLGNNRFNPNETSITPANVGKLKLRWAFAFPDTMISSSQPTIIGDTVYVGSWNGNVYALDTATGKQKWAFFTGITGKTGNIRVGVVVSHDLVLFGDQLGRFFAVNKANGTLAWIQQDIEKHPLAQITGSPVVYGDRVYVPMASREENAAADMTYPCCTFRGSLIALNIADGSVAWRFYTVDEPKVSSDGLKLRGPSGVGIWSTPAIDPDEGLIYVSTGNSYSPPVSLYSDAMLAINLKDGTLRWAEQLIKDDWANKGCEARPVVNCEGDPGKDFDFGSAPILFSVQTKEGPRKLVAAEQKNGMLHTLNALTGEIVWQKSVGKAVAYPWGLSYDGKRLYVSDNSFDKNGGIYALDPATGETLWQAESMPCLHGPEQPANACWSGYMAAAVSTPGLLWLGAMDGQIRAFDSSTGKVLWAYHTARKLTGVNGVLGRGGSIGPTNASVANGQVYVMSGYAPWEPRMMDGNVLFVFWIEQPQRF